MNVFLGIEEKIKQIKKVNEIKKYDKNNVYFLSW